MIDAAHLAPTDTVLEIGPGTGVLTRALAKRVKKVIAIEKDETLARALTRQLKTQRITNVEILEGDILTQMPPMSVPYKVVANIPYYLTARLLRLLLSARGGSASGGEEQKEKPSDVVIMIQQEVAKRIIAKPPHENLLALSVQVFGTPTLIATVPASCFAPQPDVDSAILSVSDISDNFFLAHRIDPQQFFHLARLGFSQKRKKLINSLSGIMDKPSLGQLFSRLDLDSNIRPEQLSREQWAILARHFTPNSH